MLHAYVASGFMGIFRTPFSSHSRLFFGGRKIDEDRSICLHLPIKKSEGEKAKKGAINREYRKSHFPLLRKTYAIVLLE